MAKDKANLKATTLLSRNQRILTQSLSFPAKGVSADVMSKSIDVYPVKREVKHAQKDGTKPQASGGSIPSTSRFNHPNRPTSNGPHSKEANTIGAASGLRTSLGSTSGTRCSVVIPFFVFSLVLLCFFHLLPYLTLKSSPASFSLGSLVLLMQLLTVLQLRHPCELQPLSEEFGYGVW